MAHNSLPSSCDNPNNMMDPQQKHIENSNKQLYYESDKDDKSEVSHLPNHDDPPIKKKPEISNG